MTGGVSPSDVVHRIGGSAFWATASSLSSQLLRFSVFVILSRLVSPEEFGVVALAAVLIDLMSMVAMAGVADAVVRKQTLSDEDADTAFWTSLAAGGAFLLIGWAASPFIAQVFKTPQLGPVIGVLCLTFVIWPLGVVHTARLNRDLNFRALGIVTVAANVCASGVGIALALRGYGVWALVARSLVNIALLVVLAWIACPWVPRLRFRLNSWKALSGFGSKLMGAQLVGQLNARGLELIAGLLIAPAAVGLLRIGGQCFSLMTQLTVAPLSAIAMPLLARTQGDPQAGRDAFARICRLSALMIYPVFFGAMVVSSIVFPLVFGPQWVLTGAVMPMLCALAIPVQFNLLMSAALASRGAAGTVLKWSLLQAAAGLPLSAAGAAFGRGAMLAFTVARSYLLLPIGLFWLRRNTELSPGMLFSSSARPLVASLAMAIAVQLAKSALQTHLPPVALLCALLPLGAAIYVALLLAIDPSIRTAMGLWLAARGRTRGQARSSR